VLVFVLSLLVWSGDFVAADSSLVESPASVAAEVACAWSSESVDSVAVVSPADVSLLASCALAIGTAKAQANSGTVAPAISRCASLSKVIPIAFLLLLETLSVEHQRRRRRINRKAKHSPCQPDTNSRSAGGLGSGGRGAYRLTPQCR
jgi:hypothetical protein